MKDRGLLILGTPYLMAFFLFLFLPTIMGLYLSMTDYTGYSLEGLKFIGLRNYQELFSPDSIHFKEFWMSILRTFIFVIISTPFLIGIPLTLATLTNSLSEKIGNVFRVIFYIPALFSVAAIGLLGTWFFDQQYGLSNYLLQPFLNQNIPWLNETLTAWIAILILTIWWTIGGNLIIYLAALKNIPSELYEAADIDGANFLQKFLKITIPGLKNQLIFTSIMSILASFNLYGQPAILTKGGPGRGTTTVTMYIREVGFGSSGEASLAAAMSIIFGIIMIIVSLTQYHLQSINAKKGGRV